MYSITQVENGIVKYLDAELSNLYPEDSLQKIMIGTGIAIMIKKKREQAIALLTSLGIIDDDGNVDLELLKEELGKRIPQQGIKYSNKLIGNITFTKNDIEKLYTLIGKEV